MLALQAQGLQFGTPEPTGRVQCVEHTRNTNTRETEKDRSQGPRLFAQGQWAILPHKERVGDA